MENRLIKLGDLISQRREKSGNQDLPICGVCRDGFIPPKVEDADTSIYNCFYMKDFVFNPARMELNSIVYNDIYDKAMCSSLYEMFYVNREDIILPEYLALVVKTDWFRRYCDFLGNGSAREYCRVSNISEMEINVPSIDQQKDIVKKNNEIKKRIKFLECENTEYFNIVDATFNKLVEKYKEKDVSISTVGEFVRGKNITSEEMISGDIEVISAGINPSGMHNESNVCGPVITISSSGANAGYVSLHFDDIWAADCSYCNDSRNLFYLYECLRKVKGKIDVLKDGHTGQQHVYAKDINKIEIPLLYEDKMNLFKSFAKIVFDKIERNTKEIKMLNKMSLLIIESLQ